MPYTTREAIATLSTYLGINLGVSVRSIDQTSNRGYEIHLPSDERCVIFVYPISHKQDDSKNFFDTRDSGARERGVAWNYAQTHNLKYFCLAVHDQVEKYKDYIFSLECDEHRIAEVSGTLNGSRNGRGTQVVIPTSCVPSKGFERIYTDNGFYIAVIHKDHIYEYLEQYDNRPYMDKTLPLIDTTEVENDEFISDVSPDEMEREFGEFLTNVAKNRKGKPLAPTSIRNCLLNIQKNKDFIKSVKIENIYEISSVDEILQIQEELSKNNDYIEENRDKAKGNGYYSHSLEQYKKFLIYRKEIKIDLVDEVDEGAELPSFTPSQIIYYGVPGCGKSHEIKKKLKNVPDYNKIRTVFHPEYCNADFVGQILPEVNINADGRSIVEYKFKPGPFTEIVRRAYLNPDENFYLVIEEINRGNAAAIFGEMFQLLDRLDADEKADEVSSEHIYGKGWSSYGVDNQDVNAYIRNQVVISQEKPDHCSKVTGSAGDLNPRLYKSINIESENVTVTWREKNGNGFTHKSKHIHFTANTAIRLPPNLSIYATMNTSDQNVFTLDNAFQRRWEMKQIPNELKNSGDSAAQYCRTIKKVKKTESGEETVDTNVQWGDFRKAINEVIMDSAQANGLSSMEDKRLGGWFYTESDNFAEKVLKYLWDDAFKFDRPNQFNGVTTLEELVEKFNGDDGFKVFKDGRISELQKDSSTTPDGSAQNDNANLNG